MIVFFIIVHQTYYHSVTCHDTKINPHTLIFIHCCHMRHVPCASLTLVSLELFNIANFHLMTAWHDHEYILHNNFALHSLAWSTRKLLKSRVQGGGA